LPRGYASKKLREAYTDHVDLSEAIELVGRLLGCYPNGDKPADAYVGAIAACLRAYPRQVVERLPDPVHGLPRHCKFLPTVSDVIAWCENMTAADFHRAFDREDQEAVQFARRREDEALEADRKTRLTYAELKAKYGQGRDDWGITGSEDDRRAEERKRALAAKITEEANRLSIAALDAKFNWDTAARGYSPALAKTMLEHGGKRVTDDELKRWLATR
jgi:hypothetical protein